MRRIALTGLLFLLSGCTGFGHFISDTHTLKSDPNAPNGNSISMQRADGQPGAAPVIHPQAGQVWPTAIPTMPSLAQIQKQMNLSGNGVPQLGAVPAAPGQVPGLGTLPGMEGTKPMPQMPVKMPRTNLTPSPSPGVTVPPNPSVPANPSAGIAEPPSLTMPKVGTTIQTPQGAATITGGTSNYQTLGPIGGQSGGILIPNGNNTSTLVMPNGTISTVQSPH